MAFVRKEKKQFWRYGEQCTGYISGQNMCMYGWAVGIYQMAGGGWAGMSQPGNGGVVGAKSAEREEMWKLGSGRLKGTKNIKRHSK